MVDRAANGKAVQFPGPSTSNGPTECPRAVLEIADAPFLNPGRRSFRFGATLLVRPEDETEGANVLQKGVAGQSSSMWKIELGSAGKVRCVVVTGGETYTAQSDRGIADGEWHDVRCVKTDNALSIHLAGSPAIGKPVPADVSIESPGQPLTVGGVSEKAARERYAGALDNVFYELG